MLGVPHMAANKPIEIPFFTCLSPHLLRIHIGIIGKTRKNTFRHEYLLFVVTKSELFHFYRIDNYGNSVRLQRSKAFVTTYECNLNPGGNKSPYCKERSRPCYAGPFDERGSGHFFYNLKDCEPKN